MKSTEVYKILRGVIAPWCKDHGFKRIQSGMLGWYKQLGNEYLVFWFQCSMDGWDEYSGSKFNIEFQLANEPFIGVGSNRKRIHALLDRNHLEQARQIQNDVIIKLIPPKNDYFVLHISPEVTKRYLAQFKAINEPYQNIDDIWLRYHNDEDVKRWALFVFENLPIFLSRFIPNIKL